jgi:hypothetical protein
MAAKTRGPNGPETKDFPKFGSTRLAAKLLGVPESYLAAMRWCDEGPPYFKDPSGKFHYDLAAARAWQERQPANAEGAPVT